MEITKTCPITKKEVTLNLDITQDQIDNWKNGGLIQEVMPNLTPDEREFLKTGISPEGWKLMFGESPE